MTAFYCARMPTCIDVTRGYIKKIYQGWKQNEQKSISQLVLKNLVASQQQSLCSCFTKRVSAVCNKLTYLK